MNAQQRVVSLEEALAKFRSNGFDLLLADAAVRSARADRTSAGMVPNPAVGLSAGKTFRYDPRACNGCSDIIWTASLSDQAAIVDSIVGKRSLRIKVADAALEAAKMSRADAQRTLEFALRQQYLQTALAKASRDFAVEVAHTLATTADLVAIRYNAGAVSEADVAKVDTEKLETDQAVDAANQRMHEEEATLSFLMGGAPSPDAFDVDDGILRRPLHPWLRNLTRDDLVRLASEHRPDLKAARFQELRAAASIDQAKRQRFPDIALNVGYLQEGSGQNAIQPPTFTVGVSAPLPLFYQNQGEIAKAEADRRAQSIAQQKTRAQVVLDVDAAFAGFTSNRSRVERMQSSLRERARRALELVSVQYAKGAASLLELLDAQRTFISINLEFFQNVTDYWTSVFQLEQAVGMELAR